MGVALAKATEPLVADIDAVCSQIVPTGINHRGREQWRLLIR